MAPPHLRHDIGQHRKAGDGVQRMPRWRGMGAGRGQKAAKTENGNETAHDQESCTQEEPRPARSPAGDARRERTYSTLHVRMMDGPAASRK